MNRKNAETGENVWRDEEECQAWDGYLCAALTVTWALHGGGGVVGSDVGKAADVADAMLEERRKRFGV